MNELKVIFDAIVSIMNYKMNVLGYNISFMQIILFLAVLSLIVRFVRGVLE